MPLLSVSSCLISAFPALLFCLTQSRASLPRYTARPVFSHFLCLAAFSRYVEVLLIPYSFSILHSVLDTEDYDDGSYGPTLVRLAWHCSGTYDKNSGNGGSNGKSLYLLLDSQVC